MNLCVYIEYDKTNILEVNLGLLEKLNIDNEIKTFIDKTLDDNITNSYLYIGNIETTTEKRNIEKIIVFQNKNFNDILKDNNEKIIVLSPNFLNMNKKFFIFSDNKNLIKELYQTKRFKYVQMFQGLNCIGMRGIKKSLNFKSTFIIKI